MVGEERKLSISLLFIRLSVFLVMFMWTVEKFINPGHAIKIIEKFYYMPGSAPILIYGLATLEMIVLLLFVAGCKKKYTYGAVLVFHALSTLSGFKQYLSPFEGSHLLFFAAWPMLAACFTLFVMRDNDKLTLGGMSKS